MYLFNDQQIGLSNKLGVSFIDLVIKQLQMLLHVCWGAFKAWDI